MRPGVVFGGRRYGGVAVAGGGGKLVDVGGGGEKRRRGRRRGWKEEAEKRRRGGGEEETMRRRRRRGGEERRRGGGEEEKRGRRKKDEQEIGGGGGGILRRRGAAVVNERRRVGGEEKLDLPGQRKLQCTLKGRLHKVEDDNARMKMESAWQQRFPSGSAACEDDHEIYHLQVEDVLLIPNVTTVKDAFFIWVDRLGFDMRVLCNDPQIVIRDIRIPFAREVTDERDARSSLTMMAQLAWETERMYVPADLPLLQSLREL
ncbi:hypothetical protein CBR_g22384 [Chara braunii]|uniref:DUF2470 domain-containing protein n=1 Tax=Chara braunii TaxID=69332 RepID=A0A388JUZ6_CHABU|nr:hypothetical protein CBR_g22384 [Chara braunii]|eukprot:GBG61587.1 hypothetical protein CBR_g22384 [Chara braunii]